MPLDEQRFYWLFSACSQTIAAFIAFLVTGFAVVLNMMDSLQQKDETLAELHNQIKADYYKRIFFLTVISGTAIVASLSMIFLNGTPSQYKQELFAITLALNIIAISLAVYFIISIINPNKYKIAAKEIIEGDKNEFSTNENNVAQALFMNEFGDLERKLRKILKRRDPSAEEENERIGFRPLVSALFEKGIISKEELYELLQINKYRNLVFHGHLETVNRGMLDRIKSLSNFLDQLPSNGLGM
jgi:hypothetical protein